MSFPKTVVTANVAVFSGLAIILTYSKAEIAFPVLPYLKFDFAEIPSIIVLLLFGPAASLLTAMIHWISLTMTRGWIIGPLMKFIAVVPMIIGFWIGGEISKRISHGKNTSFLALFIMGNFIGILLRVIVTTAANVALFLIVDPRYLIYARGLLAAIGLSVSSDYDVLLWVLLFTGIFNALHVLLSTISAGVLVKIAIARAPQLAGRAWISSGE